MDDRYFSNEEETVVTVVAHIFNFNLTSVGDFIIPYAGNFCQGRVNKGVECGNTINFNLLMTYVISAKITKYRNSIQRYSGIIYYSPFTISINCSYEYAPG